MLENIPIIWNFSFRVNLLDFLKIRFIFWISDFQISGKILQTNESGSIMPVNLPISRVGKEYWVNTIDQKSEDFSSLG